MTRSNSSLRALLLAAAMLPAGVAHGQSFFGKDAPPPAAAPADPPVAAPPPSAARPPLPLPRWAAESNEEEARRRAQRQAVREAQAEALKHGEELWQPTVDAAVAASQTLQAGDPNVPAYRELQAQINREVGRLQMEQTMAWANAQADIRKRLQPAMNDALAEARRHGQSQEEAQRAITALQEPLYGPTPFTSELRPELFALGKRHYDRIQTAAVGGDTLDVQMLLRDVPRDRQMSLTLITLVDTAEGLAKAIEKVRQDAQDELARLNARMAAVEATRVPLDLAAMRREWTDELANYQRGLDSKREAWVRDTVARITAEAKQMASRR